MRHVQGRPCGSRVRHRARWTRDELDDEAVRQGVPLHSRYTGEYKRMNTLCKELGYGTRPRLMWYEDIDDAIRSHTMLVVILLQHHEKAAAANDTGAVAEIQSKLRQAQAAIAELQKQKAAANVEHGSTRTRLSSLQSDHNKLLARITSNVAAQQASGTEIANLRVKIQTVQDRLQEALRRASASDFNASTQRSVIEDLRKQLGEKDAALRALSDQHSALQRDLERIQASLKNKKLEGLQAQQLLTQTTRAKDATEKQLRDLQQEVDALRRQLGDLTSSQQGNQQTIARLTGNLQTRNGSLADQQAKLQEYLDTTAKLQASHAACQAEAQALSAQLEALSAQKLSSDDSHGRNVQQIGLLQTQLEDTLAQRSTLETTINHLRQQIVNLQVSLKSCADGDKACSEELSTLRQTYQEIKSARDVLLIRLRKMKTEQATLQTKASAREAELQNKVSKLEANLESVLQKLRATEALLRSSADDARRNREQANSKHATLLQVHSTLSTDAAGTQAALDRTLKELQAAQIAYTALQSKSRDEESQLHVQINTLTLLITQLKVTVQEKDSTIQDLTKKQDTLILQLQQETDKVAQLQDSFEKDTQSLQGQRELLQKQLIVLQRSKENNDTELQNEISRLKLEIERLTRQLKECGDQQQRVSEEALQQEHAIAENRNKLRGEVDKRNKIIDDLQSKLRARDLVNKARNVANRGKEDQLQRLQRQMRAYNAKAETNAQQLELLKRQIKPRGRPDWNSDVVHETNDRITRGKPVSLEENRPGYPSVRVRKDRPRILHREPAPEDRAPKSKPKQNVGIGSNGSGDLIPAYKGRVL